MKSEEWYSSVVDVIAALTESANPTDYLKKVRKRDSELASFEADRKFYFQPASCL